jgi:hypothetical protein
MDQSVGVVRKNNSPLDFCRGSCIMVPVELIKESEIMKLFAVRNFIPYESDDIVALFTTMEKAENFVARMADADVYYELSIKPVLVDADEMTV